VIRRWTYGWARQLLLRFVHDPVYRIGVIRRLFHFLRTGRIQPSTSGPGAYRNGAVHYSGKYASLFAHRKLTDFEAWLEANQFTAAARADLVEALDARAGRLPLISILTPLYNTPPKLLQELAQSIRAQVYENWELCLVDDASSAPESLAAYADLARSDPRIKLATRVQNGGISEATNDAANMASGDIIAFVDHDDLITPDCMAELALYYADHPTADLVYSDDDKISMDGVRFAPQFKPDYSATLLQSFMYFGHIFSVRRTLFEALGGFRKAFDGSQDFDFALRAAEQARHVGHIPKILYHWRAADGSTASDAQAKPESFEAGRLAVQEALDRRGAKASAVQPDWAKAAACGIFSSRFGDTGPDVTLIIPTRNGLAHLKPCLTSLRQTTYANYQVMVVDNDSEDPASLAYLAEVATWPGHRVERISNNGGPFSFARVNNQAVARASTEFVLLLNDDTEVIAPDWLSQMMGHAQAPGVGSVGAKLLFGDGTIQHAGIVHGYYGGMAGPAFRNFSNSDWGYLNQLVAARECSSVTAACLLVRRSLYLEMGGLDEQHFNVAYNDVDFGYRLVDRGLTNIHCPEALLFHHEGKTRGHNDNPREITAFRHLYRDRIDPWYNPNLTLDNEHFAIRGARLPRRNRRPVRIAMVSHNLEHEGAPNSMLELASGLKLLGLAEPVILSPADGPLRAQYEALGLTVTIIQNPIADIHTRTGFLATRKAFAQSLGKLQVEALYANTLQTFWAISAAASIGVPTIWNPRESDPCETYFNYLSPELRPFAYEAFHLAYAVVFVAKATRDHWRAYETRGNFRVIPNGISLDRLTERASRWTKERARAELGLESDTVCLTLVGTVCERKGQIDLVRALSKLASNPKIRAFIVGDRAGPYSEALHSAIAQLPAKMAASITVVGETGDPYLYFRAADVALCTSKIESYPRIVLEAMACELPIVTTPVFGIPEQVREGVNALFYPPGDAAQLACALDALIEDADERERMGAASPIILQGLTSYSEMLGAYGSVIREAALCRGAV
jgi:GT2 family glycosyltransferase